MTFTLLPTPRACDACPAPAEWARRSDDGVVRELCARCLTARSA
jgi:hypothetical protein